MENRPAAPRCYNRSRSMPLNISYMGTKRRLASDVAKVVALAPSGPMLDLFSGMCAVASKVTSARQIWCNDAQEFAAEVAAAFFTSDHGPRISDALLARIGDEFVRNEKSLRNRFASHRWAEKAALDSGSAAEVARCDALAPNIAASRVFEKERAVLSRFPQRFPYQLFTTSFSGAYFGLDQCIEIDSIKFAVDRVRNQRIIESEQHRWMVLALCQAACKVANTTGHFAQFLKVKRSNVDRFIRQRSRSVWSEWLDAVRSLRPLGSRSWRQRNRIFQRDALSLLHDLRAARTKPSVIYADPPYTSDHYSRFYHVYETLVRYDYPEATGIGRYRPDRFRSNFCLRTQIAYQIDQLVERCSLIGAELVLSYPENGLLQDSRNSIGSILLKHYPRYEAYEIKHFHSSLGGSKGFEKRPVVEIIYRAH
jgi:adenine-specific DNA-methyltransferase